MNRLRIIITAILIVSVAIVAFPSISAASDPVGDTSIGNNADPYYEDDYGNQQVIDNSLIYDPIQNTYEMGEATYSLSIKPEFTAGQVLTLENEGKYISLQPMALEWTNDLDMIQQVSMPQNTTPTVTNPLSDVIPGNHEGTITWENAYGNGIDFQWESTARRLNKILTVSGLNDLPPPAQYIQDGGNPVLRLNLIFDPTSDVDIYIDEVLWDKSSERKTFERVVFQKDDEILWSFEPLLYWDNNGDKAQSVATVNKTGQSLYISIRVPYSWLQSAIYPVFIDADVTVGTNAYTNLNILAQRGGIFWTSSTVGYVIFVDDSDDLKHRKTSDGGATWAAAVNIRTGSIASYDCWADWQTAGDTGTKINIAYIDSDSDDIRYVYLDTDDDSVGGDDQIETAQGTGDLPIPTDFKSFHHVSITKTRGGNLAVAFRYWDSGSDYFYSFYTSSDGDTWTSEASPWDNAGTEQVADYILLFPGNEADNQDVWATFWDISAKEISLKTYDDSGDSWSEQLISANMTYTSSLIQMDGVIRLSDGHLVFAAWSAFASATADLKVWDINGAGSITAKTNVITDTAIYYCVSVFINHVNDYIYVAYAGGTGVFSLVTVFYQYSDDDGATWEGQTAMQAGINDDERWISAGAVKVAWGGKFLPVWFNDDLNNLYVNTDNGISIAAVALLATVETYNSDISGVDVTLHGEITATGGGFDSDYRGFVYGYFSFSDPGNVAPGATGYDYDWTEAGSFGVEEFSHDVTMATQLSMYYVRACAHSADGWAYGDEVSFFVGETDKVYLELRPDLDETRIRGNLGIPTGIKVGVFTGYSLPIWNEDDEELYFLTCVPDRWDGESHIVLHIKTALVNANESGNSYQLQIEWENVTANEEEIPITTNTVTFTRTVYSNTQYECYQDSFVILYNADVTDDIKADDELAIRLRRVAAGGQLKELDGELIILHEGIIFARGDLLGDPDEVVTTGDLCGLVEGCSGIATADDLTGYVTTAEIDDTATVLQGLILLMPLILFSILAHWKRHPVLYMITGALAVMTGLKAPDILTGTTTPLSITIGALLVIYAFVCLALAMTSIFRRRRQLNGTEN